MLLKSCQIIRKSKFFRLQHRLVSPLINTLVTSNSKPLSLNFNFHISKNTMHSQPEKVSVQENLEADTLGSPIEDLKRKSDSLNPCTSGKQVSLDEKQKETPVAKNPVTEENLDQSKEKEVTVQPRKPKKVKKPKPTDLNPLVIMDLHTLNPKLINNPDNKEYLKSLFYQYLPFELYKTYEVEIVKMASNGRGIGKNNDVDDWFILVPFTAVGDKVLAKVIKNTKGYSEADLVEVLQTSKIRRLDSPCKYAGSCAGCQWQHIDYENQLVLKEDYLKRAFFYGSRPVFELIPFDEPERSPLKTAYRTKLTPHFDVPKPDKPLAIGFNQEGWRRIMDIEDCILATPTVSQGYKEERVRVKENLPSYKRGATLIIRDSDKGVVTNHKHNVTQTVGKMVFEYPAGSFFQINASILPRLTEYVMDEFRAVGTAKYLLDVYCGSGLFAVACSSAFEKVVGVDVSDQSISCASHNAKINSQDNCSFKLGNAEVIFDGLGFPGHETAVIIDPPRKGCSEDFIRQLIDFGPQAIVYVSCNPFTQARDLLMLLSLTGGLSSQELIKNDTLPVASLPSVECISTMSHDYLTAQEAKNNWDSFESSADQTIVGQYSDYLGLKSSSLEKPKFTYRVVKVKPFDMFPQTMHIESLLTLVKVPLP